MICVAADTTSTYLALVLIKDGESYAYSREVGKSGHSSLLMPALKELLDSHDVAPEDLDAVAVVVGPGSFTGIRIGVAAMTALAFATGAKRIAVNSFELIAYNKPRTLAAIDAGHGNAYVAECVDGRVENFAFYTAEQADEIDGADFGDPDKTTSALAAVVRRKLESGEFVPVLQPFYMRKSQAEREKDGN